MERILTNKQVEWLTNIKILSDYKDDYFLKEDMAEKLRSFIENEFPGEEVPIVCELEVLEKKGFLVLEAEFDKNCVSVSNVNITKKGQDYLIMLEEDFAERIAVNDSIVKLVSQQASSKDILDYVEQISTIASNFAGLIPTVGNLCQGAIPIAKKMVDFVLTKSS